MDVRAPALVLALLCVLAVPGPATAVGLPFQDPGLPVDVRVDDLMSRLTVDEKLSLLHQAQAPIPRLGIPYFKTGTEALHGVGWSNDPDDRWNLVRADRATVFPQALGLASTWNPSLIQRVGAAVGDEARGYHAADPDIWGLQLWAPVVNLLRDPRWGKNEEGYSEDPYLTGAIATAYGKGLSGDHPVYLKTAPVLKHYLAYNNEKDRSLTSSNVPPRVRHEYEDAAFRPPIAAGAATGVMGAYNMVNGRPSHVNPDLNDVVRTWTGKELYNVSDAWAPHALTQLQNYYASEDEAYAAMLKAGLDSFTVDNNDAGAMVATLKSALARGLLSMSDVDASVRRALTVRLRLGQFDPDGGPYASIDFGVVDAPAHRALNRHTAASAMVLLRNSVLPFARPARVAVVGPLHDTLYGDWYGGALPYQVTPLDGIRARGATVTGVDGLDRVAFRDAATGRYLTATDGLAVAAPGPPGEGSQWDVTDWTGDVSTLRNAANGRYLSGEWGTYHTTASEIGGWWVSQQFRLEPQSDGTHLIAYAGYDTNEAWWPYPENYLTIAADGTLGIGPKAAAARLVRELIRDGAATAAAAAQGADAVVVVVGSHPYVYGRENHDRTSLALGPGQQALIDAVTRANPNAAVVLETSYPVTLARQPDTLLWTTHGGSETGHALADVLFGDRNPAGRLTQTWPRSAADLPPDLSNYDIIASGQTYLYDADTPAYAFGHGLSYTRFRYSRARVAHGVVSVDVTNTGRRAGDEVVQLYTHQRTSRDRVPRQQLRGFSRVTLAPGQTRTVHFRLSTSDLAHWDVTRSRPVVESSVYDLLLGASSTDIRQRVALPVRGETIPPRDLRQPTRAENFDGYAGARLVDETKARGTAVEVPASGGWLKFAGARLDATRLTARVAAPDAGGTIEVRLDSPTGPLAGTATVPSTGDRYAYTTVTAPLTAATGTRDIYLVLRGAQRLSTFTLSP
ncbi:glycoside hydrolase family 3 C-terminal domain-containing protein [Actinomycetes bacterium KLBMP 9797]